MFVFLAFPAILLASSLVVSLPLEDDPLVDLIKELIYQADQYLAKEDMDHLNLPDIGFHPWLDPIKLRNGLLGNFSTIQLRGTPNATNQDNSDGSMTFHVDLPLGLDHLGLFYVFRIDILDKASWAGNFSLWTGNDSADVNLTFRTGGAAKCFAKINSFVIKEFGKLQINILPLDLPEIVSAVENLLDFIAVPLIPVTNLIVKEVIATDFFMQKFSKIVCSKVPSYFMNYANGKH